MVNFTYMSDNNLGNSLNTDDRIFMILIIKFRLDFKEDVLRFDFPSKET